MAETRKIIRIALSDLANLANQQIGVETGLDADLNFRMWGGKDASGAVTLFLAKDKAARLAALTMNDLAALGATGIPKYNSSGNISGEAVINNLFDVNITSIQDNQILIYDSGTSKWINSNLPATGLTYKGAWDASTNTPTLGSGGSGGINGDYYIVSVAGTTTIDGESDWQVGDWIINNGSTWQKIDNTDLVTSVNGATGAVVVTLDGCYDADTGTRDIDVDDGDISWNLTGYNYNIDTTSAGSGAGFRVFNASDNLAIVEDGSGNLNLSADVENLSVAAQTAVIQAQSAGGIMLDASLGGPLLAYAYSLFDIASLTGNIAINAGLSGSADLAAQASNNVVITALAGGANLGANTPGTYLDLAASGATTLNSTSYSLTDDGAGGVTFLGTSFHLLQVAGVGSQLDLAAGSINITADTSYPAAVIGTSTSPTGYGGAFFGDGTTGYALFASSGQVDLDATEYSMVATGSAEFTAADTLQIENTAGGALIFFDSLGLFFMEGQTFDFTSTSSDTFMDFFSGRFRASSPDTSVTIEAINNNAGGTAFYGVVAGSGSIAGFFESSAADGYCLLTQGGMAYLDASEIDLLSQGDIVFEDGNKSGSTYTSELVLSDASGEWDTFESNFGEVSLLNAINQAANVSATTTLDEAYNNDTGERLVTIDDGDVRWLVSGSYWHETDIASATPPNGDAYGWRVINGTDYIRATNGATDAMDWKAEVRKYEFDSVAASYLNVTAADLTISTTTSGALALDSAGALNIEADASSVWNVTAADLTISTTTSGGITIDPAGELSLEAGSNLVFNDGNKSGSTYTSDLVLSDASGEWDTFESNFGEVSLLNAMNQLSSLGSLTLDDCYNNSGGAASVTIDAGNLSFVPSGSYWAQVDIQLADTSYGWRVLDGSSSEYISVYQDVASNFIWEARADKIDFQSTIASAISFGNNSSVSTSTGTLTLSGADDCNLRAVNDVFIESNYGAGTTGQVYIGTATNPAPLTLQTDTTTGAQFGTTTTEKLGFYGATPIVQPSAYTQTYSTADKTHTARTAAAITDSIGGSVSTTLSAIPDPADSPATADALRDDLVANVLPKIRDALSSIADQVGKNKTDSEDTAQVLNAVIDDLQALGFVG